ncbi:hypothetical protein F4813DRAFT_341731 [Daldinia decipiens]|uniref:uncharacterized protein n=1 Tax=Daldinia decipiens TaxID=326647 RepID=UPI0020C2683B|nr:uncharacterized protein F4813DRAFT_341731 [Daldinia decipiens]KAI1662740.1 hypothetical protein F4813DRAFT_341731 [Daldinia decipiens]
MDIEPRFSKIVAHNLQCFKILISSFNDDPIPRAARTLSHLARFKLWAGNLGAHRQSGSRSLEYRLRDASSLRKYITSLLLQLRSSLEKACVTSRECTSEDESEDEHRDPVDKELAALFRQYNGSNESTLDLILGDVGHILDCLLRLSITITNPAPYDQFKSRAEDGSFANLPTEWDIRHVEEKFPSLSHDLAERLGKAITFRRQYFKYREDHYRKLSEGIQSDSGVNEDIGAIFDAIVDDIGEQTTIASPIPQNLSDYSDELNLQGNLTVDLDSRSEISRTSYAPSSLNPDQLRVPPLPKGHLDGPFMCQFCYFIIEVDSRQAWKKHVFRDLRPYVCLEPCLTADHQFSHRSDWASHMRNVHWRQWHCPLGCSQNFDTVEEARAHLMANHTDDLESGQRAVGDIGSQPDIRKAEGNCPVCFNKQINTAQQYYSHVGDNLEQLSLFALPYSDADEDEDEISEQGSEEEEDGTNSTGDNIREQSRSRMRNDPRSLWRRPYLLIRVIHAFRNDGIYKPSILRRISPPSDITH